LHRCNLVAPPSQLDACDCGIAAFIDRIVDFAAKRIQCGNGASPFGRQEQKAVIKAGPALCGFLLALFVWGHEQESGLRPARNVDET
jgi:hypothetical protein